MNEVVWSVEQALVFCKELWPKLEQYGWHVGLTGSCLYRGDSIKDLDLVCYPRIRSRASLAQLHQAMIMAGCMQTKSASTRLDYWKRSGCEDTKHVETWSYNGKRIDLIVWTE